MKRTLLLTILFSFLSMSAAMASLLGYSHLVGRGEAFYLGFIKVYDAYLYSELPIHSQHILDADVSKCLHLEYAVGIDRKDFINAANTVLDRQFDEDVIALVSRDIEKLHDGYSDVKEGDSYTLCYDHEDQTTILKHNQQQVVSIRSAEFARVYFSIWLGDSRPLDEDLRDSLLGILP